MFGKFGEFDSWEELNKLAAGLKEEGDIDSLKELAEENGIDKEDAEDYMDGVIDTLVTPISAALGRLKIEEQESKLPREIKSVLYLVARDAALDMQTAVRMTMKGKRLDMVIETMRAEASKNKSGNVGCVCGTDRDLKKRIQNHYMGG